MKYDTITPPSTYEFPDDLEWYRDRLERIVKQHDVTCAGIRMVEGMSKANAKIVPRFRLEGALFLALRVLGIRAVPCMLARFASTLELGKNASAAKQALAAQSFRGIDWADLKEAERESVMTATSTLE